jgi:hypothetical protein
MKMLSVGRHQPAEHSDLDRAIAVRIEAFQAAKEAWLRASAAHHEAAQAHRDAGDIARANERWGPSAE